MFDRSAETFSGDAEAPYVTVSVEYDRAHDISADSQTSRNDVGDVSRSWTVGRDSSIGRPVVEENTVYLGTTTAVEAVDSESGKRNWRTSLVTDPTYKEPLQPRVVPETGTIVSGTATGTIVGLEATSGAIDWQRDVRARTFGQPTVSSVDTNDGRELRVFVGTQAGTVHALAAKDGTPRWQTTIEPTSYDLATGNSVLFPVATDGERVYVSANDGSLTVLDATTGELRRRLHTPEMFDWGYHATPTVADGTVYYNTRMGPTAYDPATGEQQWDDSARIRHDLVYAPVVTDDTVLASGPSAPVYALDRETGEIRWESGSYASELSVVVDTVYTTAGDAATAIDVETGEVLWRYPTGVGHLTATEDGIYAVGRNNDETTTLYALDEVGSA
nr:PQQ-binding-like beta-propeller repeat protein [Halovenus rubra]